MQHTAITENADSVNGDSKDCHNTSRHNLHTQLQKGIEVKAVIQYTGDDDKQRTQQNTAQRLCIFRQIAECQRCNHKSRKDSYSAQQRHGYRVHAALILGNIHSADFIGQNPG